MKYFEIITTYGWGIYAALSPPPKIVEGTIPTVPPLSLRPWWYVSIFILSTFCELTKMYYLSIFIHTYIHKYTLFY